MLKKQKQIYLITKVLFIFQPKKLNTLDVVYPEDEIRREFQEQHGNGGEIYNCIESNLPKFTVVQSPA